MQEERAVLSQNWRKQLAQKLEIWVWKQWAICRCYRKTSTYNDLLCPWPARDFGCFSPLPSLLRSAPPTDHPLRREILSSCPRIQWGTVWAAGSSTAVLNVPVRTTTVLNPKIYHPILPIKRMVETIPNWLKHFKHCIIYWLCKAGSLIFATFY